MKSLGIPISLRALLVCAVLSLLAAALAYEIGKSLTPVYQSASTVRVIVPTQGGLNDPVVTAANDLTAQYAQLVSSDAVTAIAAKRLGVAPVALRGQLTGSTISAQNLLQVTGSGDSAALAERRSEAGSFATLGYISALNGTAAGSYLKSVRGQMLSQITPEQLAHAERSSAQLRAELTSDRAQVIGQTVRDSVSGQPTLQIIDLGRAATEISPKPKLYALIAFLVVALVTLRLAFSLRRSRSAPGPVGATPAT